jgi:alpha-L-arabinofuranosidase
MLSTMNIFPGLALIFPIFCGLVTGATLTVSTTGGNASSPLLYGLMFEVLLLFLA